MTGEDPMLARRAAPAADAREGGNDRYSIVVVAACPFPFPRGTPARVFRMSEALALRGHDVHVVTYHLGDRSEAPPFQVHRIRSLSSYDKTDAGPSLQKLLLVDGLLARETVKVVRRVRPDVIHAHHYEGLGMALLARRLTGTPVVYDAHTLLESELPYYSRFAQPALRWLGRAVDRRLPGRADAIVAVNAAMGAELARWIPRPIPIRVIQNGVEAAFFETDPVPGEAADVDRTLIYAGNFAAYQRIDLMLEAFRRVLARRPHVRLRVISVGEPTAPFQKEVRRFGVEAAVDLVESGLDGLPRQLRRGRIALQPRIECAGLPQKLLNYLAAGRAVVSFAGSANHLRHGETGVVVEDGNVEAFAEAILLLLDDPAAARELGTRARKHTAEVFSWDRTAARVEALYTDLLGRDGGARD